jgi:hypothetical protein
MTSGKRFGPRLTSRSFFWQRGLIGKKHPHETSDDTPHAAPAMTATAMERVWIWIHETFPERQIYIRSDGRVQFFTFGVLPISIANLATSVFQRVSTFIGLQNSVTNSLNLMPIVSFAHSNAFANRFVGNGAFPVVMSFLSPAQMALCERVCKSWKNSINRSDQSVWRMQCQIQGVVFIGRPRPEFSGQYQSSKFALPYVPTALYKNAFANPNPLIALGESEWQSLGNVGEVPPLPHDIHKKLRQPCPVFFEHAIEETHLLMLLPETINGECLTLIKFIQLVMNLKILPEISFGGIHKLLDKYGNTPIGKSRWMLILKDVPPQSRDISYEEQLTLLDSYDEGYEVPSFAEAIIAATMTYIRSKTHLFDARPMTFIRCHAGDELVNLGGFDTLKFYVNLLSTCVNNGMVGVQRSIKAEKSDA